MYYDLHVHSNKSDGKYSRNELLKMAETLGLEYLAFTDHDYFDNKNINSYHNITVINGIELTIDNIKNMHILGYDIKNSDKLIQTLEVLNKENQEICINLIKKLKEYYDFKISLEDFKDGNISKGKIREVLVNKGYAPNLKIAGDLYTGSKSKYYEKTKSLNYIDAINLINECDGIPILAHPSTIKYGDDDLEKLIKELKDIGLQGIEVLNKSKITEKQVLYEQLANKYNLLTSCGSDFHRFNQTANMGVNNDKSLKLIKKIVRR